jgi:hypothetical protein
MDPAQGTRNHQSLLRRLVVELQDRGYAVTYNREVDARLSTPKVQVLFEVKTGIKRRLERQMRLSVGQLLQYQYRFASLAPATILCLVLDREDRLTASDREFLRYVGIRLVTMSETGFSGLDDLLEHVNAPT